MLNMYLRVILFIYLLRKIKDSEVFFSTLSSLIME